MSEYKGFKVTKISLFSKVSLFFKDIKHKYNLRQKRKAAEKAFESAGHSIDAPVTPIKEDVRLWGHNFVYKENPLVALLPKDESTDGLEHTAEECPFIEGVCNHRLKLRVPSVNE